MVFSLIVKQILLINKALLRKTSSQCDPFFPRYRYLIVHQLALAMRVDGQSSIDAVDVK